ncbi:hypothetical protein CR513_53525, partial [Mucuna pruriens]
MHKFIDGSISLLFTYSTLSVTHRNTTITFLTSHIAQSTIYFDNEQDLLLDLQERYSKGDHFCIPDILQELHSIKQRDCNISTFFRESLRFTLYCSCNTRCTCNLSKCIQQCKYNEYVICFLKGLNENFNTVKTHILLLEPFPPINKLPNKKDNFLFSILVILFHSLLPIAAIIELRTINLMLFKIEAPLIIKEVKVMARLMASNVHFVEGHITQFRLVISNMAFHPSIELRISTIQPRLTLLSLLTIIILPIEIPTTFLPFN